MDIEIPSRRYNLFSMEKHDALYRLRGNSPIIIKRSDKGPCCVCLG